MLISILILHIKNKKISAKSLHQVGGAFLLVKFDKFVLINEQEFRQSTPKWVYMRNNVSGIYKLWAMLFDLSKDIN
jgi:hypothetical protein